MYTLCMFYPMLHRLEHEHVLLMFAVPRAGLAHPRADLSHAGSRSSVRWRYHSAPCSCLRLGDGSTPKGKGKRQTNMEITKVYRKPNFIIYPQAITANCSRFTHGPDPKTRSCDTLARALSGVHLAEMVLTKVLDVPRVLHRLAILGLQAGCAGPGNTHHPERASPP